MTWNSLPHTPPRHKVFISYHHHGDQAYKDHFIRQFGGAFVDYSVRPGDIDDTQSTERIRQQIRDDFIRDATVTIVLVGAATWKRKHVDWEIDSSLRDTQYNPRTGLLGILIPTYRALPAPPFFYAMGAPASSRLLQRTTAPQRAYYTPNNVPPRLWDNVAIGFAEMRPWPSTALELQGWIHEAFQRRDRTPPPTLARDRFGANRPDGQIEWS